MARIYGLLIALLWFASGCAIFDTSEDIFYRDMTRALEIAGKYAGPQVYACASVIQKQLDWVRKVQEEETVGVISRAVVAYLIAMDANGTEEKVEDTCAPVIGKIAIKAMRQMK